MKILSRVFGRGILPVMILLVFLWGCAPREKPVNINIRVVNGGISSRVMGEKTIEKWEEQTPLQVTVTLNGKVLAQNSTVSPESPLELSAKLEPGEYSLRFEESGGGASEQILVSMRQELWTRAIFFREGPRLGYFQVNSRFTPFDSGEWSDDSDADGGDSIIDEDEVDRRFDEIKKEIEEKKEKSKIR